MRNTDKHMPEFDNGIYLLDYCYRHRATDQVQKRQNKIKPAMMHPSVIVPTDKQIGKDGNGLLSTKTPRPSIATGMQRFISPYMGMFKPPRADSAKTQFAA